MKGYRCSECSQEAHWQGMRDGHRIIGLTKCHPCKPSAFTSGSPLRNGIYYVLLTDLNEYDPEDDATNENTGGTSSPDDEPYMRGWKPLTDHEVNNGWKQ